MDIFHLHTFLFFVKCNKGNYDNTRKTQRCNLMEKWTDVNKVDSKKIKQAQLSFKFTIRNLI